MFKTESLPKVVRRVKGKKLQDFLIESEREEWGEKVTIKKAGEQNFSKEEINLLKLAFN